jgi:hypothetical protein
MSTEWNDDDLLAGDLAAALEEARDVPPDVPRVGRELFTWRTIDAELAALVSDSADSADSTDGAAPGVAVRDEGDAGRSLVFSTSGLTLVAEVESDPPALRGQVVVEGDGGELPARVTVEGLGVEPVDAQVDDVGYFAVVPFSASTPFRLRCGRAVTPWVS